MPAKGIIRIQPIVNALSSANCLSSCGGREVFSAVSTGVSGQYAYAGLHLLSTVDGQSWTMTVESATACAFAAPTTRFTFTAQACAGAQLLTPIARPSAGTTDEMFWRGVCVPTATTDYRLGVIWVGFQ